MVETSSSSSSSERSQSEGASVPAVAAPSPTETAIGQEEPGKENQCLVAVTCRDDLDASPLLRQGVSELFRLYYDELYELGCDLGFQGFQQEFTDLPGKYDFTKGGGLFVVVQVESRLKMDPTLQFSYVAPGGVELASADGHSAVSLAQELKDTSQVVACIALRPLEGKCGEVKRMFVRKENRRCGLGIVLNQMIIRHAWSLGYQELKLDSLERLVGAVKLYESIGFQRIPPYCECPEQDHVCMNLFRDAKTN